MPRGTEEREVRSDDPNLSPEANRLITEEVQEALGTDKVEVPKDAPAAQADRSGHKTTFGAALRSNSPMVIVTLLVAVVVGGVVALATGEEWAMILAIFLHAVATVVYIGFVVNMTTETEHVDPTVAAKLEDQGVGDPDRIVTDLVNEYAGAQESGGAEDVLRSGNNERTVSVEDDQGQAAAEQETAMTPGHDPTRPAGLGSSVGALPPWVVLGAMVLSLVAAVVGGGQMWLIPALVVPAALGWLVTMKLMSGEQEQRSGGTSPDAGRTRDRRPLVIAGVTIVVAVVLMAIVLTVGSDAF